MGAGFYIERTERSEVNRGTRMLELVEHSNAGEKIVNYAINLPYRIINDGRKCPKIPKVSDIKIVNNYWQQYKSSANLPIYLYSAQYDNRKILEGDEFIRIFAMVNGNQEDEEYLCILWYEREGTVSTDAQFHKVRNFNVDLNTYMINCKIPESHRKSIPFAVSISKSKCENVTNILNVNKPKVNGAKKYLGICLKGLDFPTIDKSIYMVEWLELLKILKVDKVFAYELNVHPNMSKVLRHYINEGFVDVQPLSLPGDQPNSPEELHEYLYEDMHRKRAHEKLPYIECFYRNIDKYKYILNLDLDEVIIPAELKTWRELLDDLETEHKDKNPAGYSFKRYLTLNEMTVPHGYNPDIPEYMYILQNVYQSDEPEKKMKSVVSTELVYTLDNHQPLQCFGGSMKRNVNKKGRGGGCVNPTISSRTAFLIHYRDECKPGHTECSVENSVQDTTIWKYKDQLINNTSNKLKLLKLV